MNIKTDVLVVGAGLAGIMAALSAAEAGADVCLVSRSKICSGSSFYPGTWGLGLIEPVDNEADADDLEQTILEVGQQMADPELVHTFVHGISDGIRYLEKLGVPLRAAVNSQEKAFIPCFDHKNRSWHGLEKAGAIPVLLQHLKEQNVQMLERTMVLKLKQKNGKVCGAAAVHPEKGLMDISAASVVLATGGLGGLFRYRLNTSDVCGSGQYLALSAGASLVNIEFMQMMPGFLRPAPGTIYNEKMFSTSEFRVDGQSIFEGFDEEHLKEAMAVRSTHGPFTTRLISGSIDQQLFKAFREHPEGVTLTYDISDLESQPEFIRTYFEWLSEEKHLTLDDAVQIGIFAHASNGGIRIDTKAYTGVEGLYACGESTGMMHGADRLGGLSTANGLVFGRIAGASAAQHAAYAGEDDISNADMPELFVCEHAADYLETIRQWNFETAMVLRCRETSEHVLYALEDLRRNFEKEKRIFDNSKDQLSQLQLTADADAAIALTQILHCAILKREESRGSHFRTDCPGSVG